MSDELKKAALAYHRAAPCGKLAVVATKPLANQRDLTLAYSPGVAEACHEIVADPLQVSEMTARGNLVAVITNGTAVLGLGAIGPLAAKPVMEGKAVLFKKFSGIDVFDIEIDESDPDRLVDIIASLEPTIGGINLEDIKAPECFVVEKKLKERLNIPVFHDDQHGTAIIVGTAVLNALAVVGKNIGAVKLVASGAGAAALACLDILVGLGISKNNILVCDRKGVIYNGRPGGLDEYKSCYAVDTPCRNLDDAIADADIFLGLSAAGALSQEMVKKMAADPIIMALANPDPEILPEAALAVRPDAILATGRADYPNQVNNVLCFPYIFRGALDVGATTINEEMKLASVRALAELAQAELPDDQEAYGRKPMQFGREYLIPKPFDPRLIVSVPVAVAKAAMDSGVATRPIEDFDAYKQRLNQFVFKSGFMMKPIMSAAKRNPQRLVYAEGEDRRILRAASQVYGDGIVEPILVGRPEVIQSRIDELGLRIRIGEEVEVVNPQNDPRFRDYWQNYHQLMGRNGVSPEEAKNAVRSRTAVIAALQVLRGDADCMIAGSQGPFRRHFLDVTGILGKKQGVRNISAMMALVLSSGTYFICDTHVIPEPDAEGIAEATIMAAAEVRCFGLTPKIALLSHSNFGSYVSASSQKMQQARELLAQRAPDLEVEGEMQGDAALSETIRNLSFPESRLKGNANLLIMPNVDAGSIAYNLLKEQGSGVSVGPILLGIDKPAHVVPESVTVRGIVNLSALAVVQAQRGSS